MEFELTLIRHGETEYNKEGLMQGQVDIPLSNEGLLQARALGLALTGTTWSECWSSDLKRACQTANFLLAGDSDRMVETHVSKPLSSGLQIDTRLRERRYGVAEGKSLAHLKLLANNAGVKAHHFVPPGGETLEEVRERAISFLLDLCARQMLIKQTMAPRSSVLLVSHGGWLKELMGYLCSYAGVGVADKRRSGVKCPNCAISKFTLRLGSDGKIVEVKCLSINDVSHLSNYSAIK